MGRRWKRSLHVYMRPDDPLWDYLDRFRDQSKEAARLMRLGWELERGGMGRPAVPALPSILSAKELPGRPPLIPAENDTNPGWDDE